MSHALSPRPGRSPRSPSGPRRRWACPASGRWRAAAAPFAGTAVMFCITLYIRMNLHNGGWAGVALLVVSGLMFFASLWVFMTNLEAPPLFLFLHPPPRRAEGEDRDPDAEA